MATITSAGSGNWTSTTNNAPWPGGIVPTSADDVVVSAGHNITLNATTCACNTLDHYGTITASTSANSQLTVEGRVWSNDGSTWNCDVSSAPTITCTLRWNNARGSGSTATFEIQFDAVANFKGSPRTVNTTLTAGISAGATSATVASATNWRVGDRVILASTQAWNATPKYDEITIATVNTGTGAITWSGGTTYAHASGCKVANMTSNLIFSPNTAGDEMSFRMIRTGSVSKKLTNVWFKDMAGSTSCTGVFDISANQNAYSSTEPADIAITNCTFDRIGASSHGIRLRNLFRRVTITGCAFFSAGQNADYSTTILGDGCGDVGVISNCGVYAWYGSSFNTNPGYGGGFNINGYAEIQDSFFSSCPVGAFTIGYSLKHTNVDIFGCNTGYYLYAGTLDVTGGSNGTLFGATNGNTDEHALACTSTFTNFNTQTLSLTGLTTATPKDTMTLVNKNNDLTSQEIYGQYYSIIRNNSGANRGTSNIAIKPSQTATNVTRTVNIPSKSGVAVRVIGYVKADTNFYNGGGSNWTAPTVVLSGLGITPQTFTASSAANNAFEKFDLSATQTSGSDGNLTLTYTVNAKSVTTGTVYVDGVYDPPFVVSTRHYGFLFDAAPFRTANATISASEAAAAAYTGMTVTWGASLSTVAFSASQTFQKLYDYTQAQACLNQSSALPLTGVGVAGSPSLFAAGNITTTGFTLDGGGSINMGAFTLTANQPWAYTYTGGTFSQSSGSGVPVFSDGTLQITTTGTKTLQMTGGTLNFTTAGTYDMSGSTLASSVVLTNTSGGTVNLTLSAGQSYTNTGPNISITAPTVTRGLTFTGLVAGSQVKVFDTGTTTEAFSTSSSGTSETWSESVSGSRTVDYTVMKAGYLPIRVTGLTVTGATSGGVISTPIAQIVDRAYVASSGLTFGTTATVNAGTKKWGLSAVTTVQNWYSFMIESWIAQSALKNTAFPLVNNGPNSFSSTLGWEFATEANILDYFRDDGFRYVSVAGARAAVWAALNSVGVPSGKQARYQQTDGGTTTNAINTGEVRQLVKIYGDSTHGNFDYTGYLTVKVQAEGYDQAETDLVALYGTLEDQQYVFGLLPTANGVATGDPALSITITDHGASPVTWNGKVFSITITDNASPSSGTDILRELRYNFAAGGTYQGTDAFNWHDLAQVNGSKFKTVRGKVYGDTGATLKGVRVVKSDGTTIHPDFDLFTADDGTTYSAPVVANVSITGMPNAGAVPTRLQIINSTAAAATAWSSSTAYSLGAIRKRTSGIGTENTAGLYMRVTTAGTSGGSEPTWNTTVGGTTTDGSVVWTTYAVLFYDADPASTSYSTTYTNNNEFASGETVTIRFAEMNGGTSFKTFSTTTLSSSSGFSVAVNAEADDVYATNALDGSAYESTFSPNFASSYIVLDANTDFSGVSAYAYFCYTLTTSNGMYLFWGGVTALDTGNYRIESDVLNMYFDESAGFVKQTDSVRIFRKDGARPALDPTTGGNGIEINWRTPVSVVTTSGSSVITGDISTVLAAIPSASANATAVLAAATSTPIAANIEKVNGQTVNGTGSESDPWGP